METFPKNVVLENFKRKLIQIYMNILRKIGGWFGRISRTFEESLSRLWVELKRDLSKILA